MTMMEEEEMKKKRYDVTYTKHLKQKRKVYQDGFLDLHLTTSKVKLYDECEKLLECRILKKHEVVDTGETLTLNAYIVDVGDAQGDHKPASGSSFQFTDKKIFSKPSSVPPQKFTTNFINLGKTPSSVPPQKFTTNFINLDGRTTNARNDTAKSNNRSPSHNLIREFRRSESQKYRASQSSPATPKQSVQEWQVMYTTQVTQKAKKYHDGFLQLENCGSFQRQIMLYDETRKLIDSRFLKKEEIIQSGASISYVAHLVDIGEPEENNKRPEDIATRGSKFNILGKPETTDVQRNQRHDSLGEEWQVMYTTQVTQKAKKYHDGFLQLENRGSFGRQIMLYDATRKLLDSRFLKKDEVIQSGESISCVAHLVDIGEPEEKSKPQENVATRGSKCNDVVKAETVHGQKIHRNDSLEGVLPQNTTSSREDVGSNLNIYKTNNVKLCKNVAANKPLRDACQILAVLKRPKTEQSAEPVLTTKDLEVPQLVVDSADISRLSDGNTDMGKSTENGDLRENLFSCRVSGSTGNNFFKDAETRNLNQVNSDNVEVAITAHDETFVSTEQMKTAGCPSFDLGF